MKIIGNRDPVATLNANFLATLQNVLLENLPLERDEIQTLEACLEAYVKHEERIQILTQSSVKQENFKKIDEVLKQM